MPSQTLETTGVQEPQSFDPRYRDIEPVIRPFAVEKGYEAWADVAGLIASTLSEKILVHQRSGNLSHDEESEVMGHAFDVLRSACELGYFSRRIHPSVEVNNNFGKQLTQTILGEEYEELNGRLTDTLELLHTNIRRPFPKSETITEWEDLIRRMVPSIQTKEQLIAVFKDHRNTDGQTWREARDHRMIALIDLRKYLSAVAKQAYLWGRTDSTLFLHADSNDTSTVMHHGGLVTTDTDLEERKISAAMEVFDDSTNLPTYRLIGKISLWNEGRKLNRKYGVRPSGPFAKKYRYDAMWVREERHRMKNRDAEQKRLRQDFRANPLEINS